MRLRGFVLVGIVAASSLMSAQQQATEQPQKATTAPLGDVAREAEAAKATVKKAKKTYTNADLTADPRGGPATAPAALPSSVASPDKALTPQEAVVRSGEKTEKNAPANRPEEYWRGRAESIRTQVAGLQSYIDGLSRPDAARDSNLTSKAKKDDDLANARLRLDGLKKQWDTLEVAAKQDNANSAWLDPRPRFQ